MHCVHLYTSRGISLFHGGIAIISRFDASVNVNTKKKNGKITFHLLLTNKITNYHLCQLCSKVSFLQGRYLHSVSALSSSSCQLLYPDLSMHSNLCTRIAYFPFISILWINYCCCRFSKHLFRFLSDITSADIIDQWVTSTVGDCWKQKPYT